MPLRSVVRERFDYMLGKQLTEGVILSIIAQAGMTEHGRVTVTMLLCEQELHSLQLRWQNQ